MLEGYGKSLEEGKYNFEGTAFKDLNDLKSRINDAVTALKGGVLD
jgi:L-arabinose isomerase